MDKTAKVIKMDFNADLYKQIDELAKQRGMTAQGIIERAARIFMDDTTSSSKPATAKTYKTTVALTANNAEALRIIAKEMHTTRTNAAQDIFYFGIQEYQRITAGK